jgi:hypothetical protein
MEFVHAEIDPSVRPTFHDPFEWLAERPQFPSAGANLKCPNCEKTSLYRRYQLTYRAS